MEQIINKALSKDPNKRYQLIDELVVDLRKFGNSLEKQQTFKRLEQSAKEDHRKLAAIMFTDMVGYSALTQKSENLALELLEQHRKILRALFPKYDGSEVETAGDAFFVEFSSALAAVNCAVEIQKQLFNHNKSVSDEKQIKIRIGVHIGDVVHRGYNVLGDGVNIAARIEPCAQSGGICISQDVARQVENKIDYTLKRIETEKLKNIQLPIEIYAVVLPWLQGESTNKAKFDVKKRFGVLLPIFLIALLIVIAVFIWQPRLPLSAEKNSIAVLPFENLSAKIENEYFSDGMTEDIIAHLSKIGGLKVISRTSIMQYKNTEKNLKDIGYELNVAKILEGSVRRAGNRVRIVAQLIDAEADEHLWTETYDEQLTQIFDIQTAVAQKIAKSLKAKISEKEREQLERKATNNLEAYDLYLKGRYYWNKRMPDDLKKGIAYFEQALQKDAQYALAYSGLADSYAILGIYCILPPQEAYDKVKESAIKALQIDDQLAEAHTSMALAHMHYDWDWERAEIEFKRAIELNPKYAIAHSVYAQYLTSLKRFDEAKIYRKRAKELDPLSIAARLDEAFELFIAANDDKTIEHCQQLIQENPHLGLAYIPIAGSYIEKSMFQDAIELLSTASMLCGGHHAIVAAYGYAYAVSGRQDDALSMIEILLERSQEEYISPFWIAVVYTGLGDKKNAFIWLDNSYKQRDASLVFLDVLPIFKSLRSDPRYTKLIRNIGLMGDE
jgi:TolB-like protein/class 3 adenylate cyclase